MTFVQFLKFDESAPANSIGTGYVAGVGISPGGAVDVAGPPVDMDNQPDSDVDDATDVLVKGMKATYPKLAGLDVVEVGEFEFPEKSCAISDIPGGRIHEYIRLYDDEQFIIHNTNNGRYVKATVFGSNLVINKMDVSITDFAPLVL